LLDREAFLADATAIIVHPALRTSLPTAETDDLLIAFRWQYLNARVIYIIGEVVHMRLDT
jgi:hypothetical protein